MRPSASDKYAYDSYDRLETLPRNRLRILRIAFSLGFLRISGSLNVLGSLNKAVCWTLVYTLDFFMTSGISIIDGSVQVPVDLIGVF